MAASFAQNRIEIRAQAEEMHRQNCASPRGQDGRDHRRIDVECLRIDIDEHRTGADSNDGASRRKERIGCAIRAICSPWVPDETVTACATPSMLDSSSSRAAISGPMMNRWLSHTRVMAPRISSRSGRCWASRSSSGILAGMRVIVPKRTTTEDAEDTEVGTCVPM